MTDDSSPEVQAPLLFGFVFDADGKARKIEWEDIVTGALSAAPRAWLHLNRRSTQAESWLRHTSGIEELVADALLEEETRPRASRIHHGFLINMRGVNLNPGDALDDMISVRMWATPTLLISMRSRPMQASADVREIVEDGDAPNSTGGLVALIADALINRLQPEIEEYEDQADEFEEQLLDPNVKLPRSALSRFRRRVLTVRRYILPQREALAQLVREGMLTGLFTDKDVLYLRESADRVTRLAEDLDTLRDRSTVMQEQILEERAEMMNQRLFVLSMMSSIFMPLSFITGLFGVNIGGLPGLQHASAFWFLLIGMIVVVGLMLVVFRWRKWI